MWKFEGNLILLFDSAPKRVLPTTKAKSEPSNIAHYRFRIMHVQSCTSSQFVLVIIVNNYKTQSERTTLNTFASFFYFFLTRF